MENACLKVGNAFKMCIVTWEVCVPRNRELEIFRPPSTSARGPISHIQEGQHGQNKGVSVDP